MTHKPNVNKAFEAYSRKRTPAEAELIYQDFLVEQFADVISKVNPLSIHPDVFNAIISMTQNMVELSMLVDNDEPDNLLTGALIRARGHAHAIPDFRNLAARNQQVIDNVREQGSLAAVLPESPTKVREMMEKAARKMMEEGARDRNKRPGYL